MDRDTVTRASYIHDATLTNFDPLEKTQRELKLSILDRLKLPFFR